MSQADTGQTVKVHYKGTLDDGRQFDSSYQRGEPLEFTLGLDSMIAGFTNAIMGMTPGETKTVRIPAQEAYGEHHEELVRDFARHEFPADIDLEEGLVLSADSPDGQRVRFTVVGISEEKVTLDGNHPLAGEALTFEIELVEIL